MLCMTFFCFFFFNDTATTEIYTLSLHDALPISRAPSTGSPCSRRTARSWRWDMAHGTFKVLDSDIHIIEPPDLWPRYIDAAFRNRAPSGLTEDVGDLRLAHNGKPWGRVAVDADRHRRRQGRNYALNQERWRPFEERGWTSKVQLEATDIEGIDVAVVYPSRGLFALTI